MTPTFTTPTPPDDKGYPGQTRVVLPDGRVLWVANTGPDAEAVSLEALEGRE